MFNLCIVWIGVWEILSFAPTLGYLLCSLSYLATGREVSPAPGFVRQSLHAQSPFDLSLSLYSSLFVLLCLLDLGFTQDLSYPLYQGHVGDVYCMQENVGNRSTGATGLLTRSISRVGKEFTIQSDSSRMNEFDIHVFLDRPILLRRIHSFSLLTSHECRR